MKTSLLAGLGLLACLSAGCQPATTVAHRVTKPTAAGSFAVPPLPKSLPDPRPPRSAVDLLSVIDLQDGHLGVGTLAPVASDKGDAAWIGDMALPVYGSPGQHLGWLVNGWIVDSVPPVTKRPLLTRAMVPTGGGELAFLVLEVREDGWFRFRYAPPGIPGDGLAWAHQDHLRLGAHPLELKLWSARFLAAAGPLEYRKPEVRHALRAAPDAKAELVAWIGASHELESLEASGDWMRVKVIQPSRRCSPGQGGSAVKTAEGWIRWSSPEKGPWIWFAGDCR